MNVKQLLHCVDNLSNTYHQGHNCETHSWDEYPHPKKRDITWSTVFFLQPILILHFFSQRLQDVASLEVIHRWPYTVCCVNCELFGAVKISPQPDRLSHCKLHLISKHLADLWANKARQKKKEMSYEKGNVTAILSFKQTSIMSSTKCCITKNKVFIMEVYSTHQ